MATVNDVTLPDSFLESLDDPDDADLGNQDDGDLADSQDGEQPASDDANLGTGSPEELLARAEQGDVEALQELKKGYLRHADYTKKTQEIAAVRDQFQAVADELVFLRGKFKAEQNGGVARQDATTPAKASTRLDAVLASLPSDDDDPNTANMRKFLTDFAQGIKEEVLAAQETSIAPVKLKAAQDAFNAEMQTTYSAMKQKYGNGIDALWPDLVKGTLELRKSGERATPESVLTLYAPDKALALLENAKKETNKHKTRAAAARTSEGMETVRYRRPVQADTDIPTSQRKADMSIGAISDRVQKRILGGRKFADMRAALANQ